MTIGASITTPFCAQPELELELELVLELEELVLELEELELELEELELEELELEAGGRMSTGDGWSSIVPSPTWPA
jgi:hypothetical protein